MEIKKIETHFDKTLSEFYNEPGEVEIIVSLKFDIQKEHPHPILFLNEKATEWIREHIELEEQTKSRIVNIVEEHLKMSLEKAEKAYEKLIAQIEDLIDSSDGVAGLHRNGELADWEWLRDNGWLDF